MSFALFRTLVITITACCAVHSHATSYSYDRGLKNSELMASPNFQQKLIGEPSALAFGQHLLLYAENNSQLNVDLKLLGNLSEVREIDKAVDGSWLVRMRVGAEYINVLSRNTVVAYSADGELRWQKADYYQTPIIANASGFAQKRSAGAGCRIVQFDLDGNFMWQTQPAGSADCELVSQASSAVILLSSRQADGSMRLQEVTAATGALGIASTVAVAAGESFCGLDLVASDLYLALCGANATVIEKRQLGSATPVWRRSLTRSAMETKVSFSAQPSGLIVHSLGNEIDSINAQTGVVQWHRNLSGEVLKIRAFPSISTQVFVLTNRCVTNDCPGTRLQSISPSGALTYTIPIETVNASHVDLIYVQSETFIVSSRRSVDDYKLVKTRIDLQTGLLDDEQDVVKESNVELNGQISTRVGASSYQLALGPTETTQGGINIRVGRFRNVDGQQDWVRNFELRTTEGVIADARVVKVVANDQIVSFSVAATVRIGFEIRRRVFVERLFASTGSRLKTLEFSPSLFSNVQQFYPDLALDGSSVWVSYDEFLIGGPCNRKLRKIALDASVIASLDSGRCWNLNSNSMFALGSDVIVSNPGGFERVSASGDIVWSRANTNLYGFEVSPDQQQLIVVSFLSSANPVSLSGPASIGVAALRANDGSVVWEQELVSLSKPILLYNSQLRLANGDLMISAINRDSFLMDKGATSLFRLRGNDGSMVWRQDHVVPDNVSESGFRLHEDGVGGPLLAMKRRSVLAMDYAFADWSSLLTRIDATSGATLSTWQLEHQNEDQSALSENYVVDLLGDAGPNAIQVSRNVAPRLGDADIGTSSRLLLPTANAVGNLKLTATAQLSADAGSYSVIVLAENLSAQPVVGARLGITYAGPGEWRAVRCLDAPNVCNQITSPDRARFVMNLPANGSARFQIDGVRDPLATPDLIRAHVLAPFGLSETNLDDNDIELRIADQLLKSGFE
jgi:outer membrane protein assembly factor BamB